MRNQLTPERGSCHVPPSVRRFGSIRHTTTMALGIALAVLANSSAVGAPIAHQYQQTNLVSDVAGAAAVTDANLVNPWGLSRSAASPWWSANNGTGTSTLYTGAGAKVPLTVTIPTPVGEAPPSAPTGTVFNDSGSTTDFLLGPGQAARFLFATEDGTIAGWAGGTTAVTKINRHGWAIYKSLAIGNVNGANYLYAANFLAGTVEVFNGAFNEVHFGADAFRDWSLPGGYAPFNVQRIGNRLYVTYAKQDEEGIDEVAGHGRGYVNAYSLDGVLQLRLHTGYWMNAPWGVALAPANFGRFSNLLLVGQFGSGQIAAFDPMTGHFRGLLRGAPSRPLKIDGLWALSFGNGAAAGPVNTLYFTAGPDEETHGLFGSIAPLPGKDHDADEQDDDEDKP